MLFYICIKFHENISKGFRAIEGLLFPYSGSSKGPNSVKTVGRVMVFVFSNCLILLYICTKFHENIQKGLRGIE